MSLAFDRRGISGFPAFFLPQFTAETTRFPFWRKTGYLRRLSRRRAPCPPVRASIRRRGLEALCRAAVKRLQNPLELPFDLGQTGFVLVVLRRSAVRLDIELIRE
jgi:hypothetical protein